MNALKKAIYVAPSPKGERREEADFRPALPLRFERPMACSRENEQEARYYINGKYANNFTKLGSKDKTTVNSSKQLSKKSLDRSSLADNGKKVALTAKIKILPQRHAQSNKHLILKEIGGGSSSPNKERDVRLNSGTNLSRYRASQESQLLSNDAPTRLAPGSTTHQQQQQPLLLNANYSKLRIVSRDKASNDQKSFKISIGNQKEPIFIKRNPEKSPPKNPQRVEFYLKMDKLVSAKARSIDPKKKEPPKPNSLEQEKRPNFLSEDKDQTKYLVQERPFKLLAEKPSPAQPPPEKPLQSKNYYFQLLRKKFHESEEVETISTFVRNAFREWRPDTNLAELFSFKTQIGFYKIRQKIGKGCFGKVYLATQLLTGASVALKVIPKTNFKNKDSRRKIEKEVAILKRVNNHHSIIKLFEVFEDSNFVYMVFEYLENGDLVQYFKKQPLLEEPELKLFFYKILKGVEHLHQSGIIHRDLKLDNILLDRAFQPKVCDFGISSVVEPGKKIFDTGGTPAYLAPEVIKAEGEVGHKSDVWSLGVLLYLLNFGIVPFKANDMQILYNKIIVGTYRIPDQSFTSTELTDLIRRMLVIEVDARISVEEIFRHPWLKGLKVSGGGSPADTPSRTEALREGVMLYLQHVGFPEDFVRQSTQKGLFNHVKACFDSLCEKFKN